MALPEPPPAGKQYTTVTALTWVGDSLLGPTPPPIETPVAIGDTMITDLVTQMTGYPIAVNGDGTFVISSNGDTTRQVFQSDIYHVLTDSNDGVYTIYMNDPGPQLVSQPPTIIVNTGGAISFDFVATGYVRDPNGDTLTASVVSGTLPTGITLSGTAISGTASVAYNASVSVQFTDYAGESIMVTLQIIVNSNVTVPNLYDVLYATGIADLTALGLLLGGVRTSYSPDPITTKSGVFLTTKSGVSIVTGLPGVPAGYIMGQSVAAGTSVPQGTVVQLIVSLGPVPATVTGPYVQVNSTGFYAGVYRNIGDVFQLASPNDLASSAFNYDGSEAPYYGWMQQLPAPAPVIIQAQGLNNVPLRAPPRTVW
jgi:hypothetical protein